jgi:hypothetical protein
MKNHPKNWNDGWNDGVGVPVERLMERSATRTGCNPHESSRSTGTLLWNDPPLGSMERSTHSLESGTMERRNHFERQNTDLLGDKLSPAKHPNAKPEAAALREVLAALNNHPRVAWCERQNSGVAKVGGRFIRFGWVGCADILGQLNTGELLAVEVKAATGRLSAEQIAFLERVGGAGGVAFVAHDLRDVRHHLGDFT